MIKKENPQVALTFWGATTAESCRIKGTVAIETSGKTFEETAARSRKSPGSGRLP